MAVQIVVNLNVTLIAVVLIRDFLQRVVRQVTVDRLGVKRGSKQRCRNRADHAGRNNVAREGAADCRGDAWRPVLARRARAWIVDLHRCLLVEERAEIARLLGRSEHSDEAAGGWVIETLSLIIDEKEQLILNDLTTQRATVHVPTNGSARNCRRTRVDLVFPLVRVQLVVPEELPHIAME